jgi:hypothetical protein
MATPRKASLRSVVASPVRVGSLRMIASSLGGSAGSGGSSEAQLQETQVIKLLEMVVGRVTR